MTGRARMGGHTREQIVWDTLKASPYPMLMRELMDALAHYRLTYYGVSKTIYRMAEQGRIVRRGERGKLRYEAVGARPRDRRCEGGRRWTSESATAACHKRWGTDAPFDVFTSDQMGAKSGAGESLPQRGARRADPPPLPTLADLIAPR